MFGRFVTCTPAWYRSIFPGALWRMPATDDVRKVYLTFDDGPTPELLPWILETLEGFNAKATFFMVGENVQRNPRLLERVLQENHSVGNHTMRHRQGLHCSLEEYVKDIGEAATLIPSRLFRPPHGLMKPSQYKVVKESYRIVMQDVVSRDYDHSLMPETIINGVRRFTRNGSIIVFHDSLKARENLMTVLPHCLGMLKENGYRFEAIPMSF